MPYRIGINFCFASANAAREQKFRQKEDRYKMVTLSPDDRTTGDGECYVKNDDEITHEEMLEVPVAHIRSSQNVVDMHRFVAAVTGNHQVAMQVLQWSAIDVVLLSVYGRL